MRVWLRAIGLSALALAAAAPLVSAEPLTGYVATGELDLTHILEPAPKPGDPRYATDRKIFRATRHLIGTPRWQLATRDAETTPAAVLRDFSCAVGVTLSIDRAPKLARVLQRTSIDTGRETNEAKEIFQRRRPFMIDRGKICQPEAELYDNNAHRMSYDYPSGHTTRGWTYALVLATIAPDRAQQIMERGRGYGDSRFICGAHNESAVEAGMLSASATMAVVATKAAYQADLADARTELAALRTSGPAPQGCETEAALLRERVMPSFDAAR